MWSSYTRCWSWTCIREKEAEIYLLFDIWLLNDCAEWKIHIPACLADTGTATVTDTQHKSCLPWTAALYQLSKKQHQGASRALEPIPLMMFFRCDSTYPCRSVSEWVIDSFRLEIAIASTKLASLLYVIELLYIIDLHLSMLSVLSTLTHMFYLN